MRHASRSCGFTLVEMLVAMVLLAMIMFGLSTALRSFGQTEARVDSRISRIENVRTTSTFLRQVLAWVWGGKIPGPDGAKATVALMGRTGELAWVGVMPARYGVGGLHYLRLWLRKDERGNSLMLAYQPLKGKLAFPDWSAAQILDLSEGLESLEFAYQGQDGEPWLSQWSNTEKLPRTVRVNIHGRDADWPPLIVGLRESKESLEGSSGAVIGGGGYDDGM